MSEKTTTMRVFEKDLKLIDQFNEKKPDLNRAEIFRICIEFANAHEVFS